ncbi:MAG: hypothetical protein RMM58_00570 [Chloroflexota bacterium]|nr:hypothetical protein [Dehalococcoidia bacterium]MDW8252351.1 hypothetical protein [Chloroflexota bacterium]
MGQGWILDGEWRPFRIGGRHDLRAAAWRPGSEEALVAGNHGTLAFVGPTARVLPPPTRDNLRGIAWRPDGACALAVGDGGTIVVVAETLRLTPVLTPVNLRRAAWHPTGACCLIVGNDGLALLWTDGRTRAVGWGRAHLRDAAWRPDGEEAVIAGNGALYRYRRDEDDLEVIAELPDGDFTGVAWLPGGERFFAVGYRQVGAALDARETVAWLGPKLEPAFAGIAGHTFVQAVARPGREEVWIVQQPAYAASESRLLRWSGGAPEVVFRHETARLVQLSFDERGERAVVVGSPRAAFWRS